MKGNTASLIEAERNQERERKGEREKRKINRRKNRTAEKKEIEQGSCVEA